MIYLGLTFFLFTFSLILKKDLERRQAYYIILVILFIFSALRYEVGCDWVPYQNIFLKAADYRISEVLFSREPFFWLILIFLHEINFTYFFVNIASSFLFFIGVHALARRQPDPLAFLVLLFPILIINMPMSGIRQGAAIGILCIALLALIDKRPIKFLIWILISSGFHTSALIFIFFLPFANQVDLFH